MNYKCRYEDCSQQNPVAAEDETVTCPICRKELGLPPLVGGCMTLSPETANMARDLARDEHGSDEMQFDSDGRVIDNGADGYWVEGWAFVRYPEAM